MSRKRGNALVVCKGCTEEERVHDNFLAGGCSLPGMPRSSAPAIAIPVSAQRVLSVHAVMVADLVPLGSGPILPASYRLPPCWLPDVSSSSQS